MESETDPKRQIKNVLKNLIEHVYFEHVTQGLYRKADKVESIRTVDEFLAAHGMPPLPKQKQAKEDESKEKEPEILPVELEIGSGSEVVNAWYFPAYKELAEFKNQDTWPIKIGRSDGEPTSRIKDSIDQAPEKPAIAFLHYVDDSRESEKWYHIHMKLKKKHINQAIGDEWVDSNLSELREMGEVLEDILTKSKGVSNDT